MFLSTGFGSNTISTKQMSLMMSRLLSSFCGLFVCILIFLIGPLVTKVSAQADSQQIEIVFFSGLSDEDLDGINELAMRITKKVEASIFLQNAYAEDVRFKWNGASKRFGNGVENWEKTEVSRVVSKESVQTNPTNLLIRDGLELESLSRQFDAMVMVQTDVDWYRDESLAIPIGWNINSEGKRKKELKKLAKQVWRLQAEHERLAIIFANAPISYLRSFESFSRAFKANRGNAEFIPEFGSRGCDVTKTLKPQGDEYVFSFEGSRFFDEYEVELYEIIEGVPELIRAEVLVPASAPSSQGWTLNSARAENWFQLIFDYPRLGEECAQREMARGNDSEIDPDCPTCRYDCLYGKRYGIRIRGHHPEFAQAKKYDGLWSCLKNVLFQCEK